MLFFLVGQVYLDPEPLESTFSGDIYFDGTIFINPSQNFSIDVPLDEVLQAHSFFSEFMFRKLLHLYDINTR